MKTYHKHPLIAVALVAIFTGFNNLALAGGDYQKIGYADLDLDQTQDVTLLYQRIKDAARVVCTDKTAIWGYHRKTFNRCYQKTVDKAVMSINNVALTALHQGQGAKVANR